MVKTVGSTIDFIAFHLSYRVAQDARNPHDEIARPSIDVQLVSPRT